MKENKIATTQKKEITTKCVQKSLISHETKPKSYEGKKGPDPRREHRFFPGGVALKRGRQAFTRASSGRTRASGLRVLWHVSGHCHVPFLRRWLTFPRRACRTPSCGTSPRGPPAVASWSLIFSILYLILSGCLMYVYRLSRRSRHCVLIRWWRSTLSTACESAGRSAGTTAQPSGISLGIL